MKRSLLAVSVAATLAGLSGISAAAIWGNGPGQTSTGPRSGVWADGGRSRSRGGRGPNHRSPADRIAERAKARRQAEGG